MILNAKVDAPMQNVEYSDTYYQIDKLNQIEARYVLGKQGSKKHGWLGTQTTFLFLQYDVK